MKVLILGGCGMLGPWVVKALKYRHDIILTDINPPESEFKGDFRQISSDDIDAVVNAAEGCDAIVNLSVLREDRKLAFDVSTRGNYNMMIAAVEHNIERIINTGPHFQLVGETYENWDFDLNPDMSPQFGTRLYALSKGLGQEICRVFSEQYGIYVITMLYYNMRHTWNWGLGRGIPEADHHEDMTPFTTAWTDCGTAIRAALEVPLERLPSRCENFFTFPETPHHKFNSEKTRRILGWEPRYTLETLWNKPPMTPPDHLHGAW